MDKLLIPDTGERFLLGKLQFALNQSCELRLYKNDITPTALSVLGDFLECNFSGYGSRSLVNKWGPPFTRPDGRAQIETATQTWQGTGAGVENTVFGYYVTALNGQFLLWAQRGPEPKLIGAGGSSYLVTPRFTFRSELS